MQNTSSYQTIIVESFYPKSTSGRHGKVHIRPVPGQKNFPVNLFVECSRSLTKNYKVGTKFRIKAKLTDVNGTPFIYSYFGWPFEVINGLED